MLVFGAGFQKMLVGTQNIKQERPWYNCFFRSSLIWVCALYLGCFGRHLVFEGLEPLPFTMRLKFRNFHLSLKFQTCMKMKWNKPYDWSIFNALTIIMYKFHLNITISWCVTSHYFVQGSNLKSHIVIWYLVWPVHDTNINGVVDL